MSVLAVRSLSKTFGGVRAVNDVSFDIARGEFLAMIGPNGAGKSTCFNMINGQLEAIREILFAGRDIAGLEAREVWRLGVGRTFQVAATFGSMTVVENVQMALISHARETYHLWRPASNCIAIVRLISSAKSACARPPSGLAANSPMGM